MSEPVRPALRPRGPDLIPALAGALVAAAVLLKYIHYRTH